MTEMDTRVRQLREARGLSQTALAERVGLTRQSIGAIEAGKATPGVDIALRLARSLECSVEELFGAPQAPQVITTERVEGPPNRRGVPRPTPGKVSADPGAADREHLGRYAVARIAGRWLSYPLGEEDLRVAADGVGVVNTKPQVQVEALRATPELEDNLVLMGCASALGLLADRLNARGSGGRFHWFCASSGAALQALGAHHTHIAGIHLTDPKTDEGNVNEVRRLGLSEAVTLVTFARWEMGLVVRPSGPEPIRNTTDLGRPGLRFIGRESGAGAQRLLERTAREQGVPIATVRRAQLQATSHLQVARSVALGASDVGVATRDVATALGLAFIPLTEERYDLALSSAALSDARVQRLMNVLVTHSFRRELEALGYDTGATGEHVAEVRAVC